MEQVGGKGISERLLNDLRRDLFPDDYAAITAATDSLQAKVDELDRQNYRVRDLNATLQAKVERLEGELKPFRPMSIEEAEAEIAAVEAEMEAEGVEPISEEQVEHALKYATDPVYRADWIDAKYKRQWQITRGLQAELTSLQSQLAAKGEEKELPAAVLEICRQRNWSLHWTARGAYLHLEASELIEAIRGKHGVPMEEAADVLIVLMSITEHAGIDWQAVVNQAWAKVRGLQEKPSYKGEERVLPPAAESRTVEGAK